MVQRGALFHVRTGPDGALGIVQDFGCNRTEQKSAERPVSVSRHHNQAYPTSMRELGNDGGRFAHFRNPLNGNIRQLLRQCSFHALLNIGLKFRVIVNRGRVGWLQTDIWNRIRHVQQRHICVESLSHRIHKRRGAACPFRKIDGEKNMLNF
jgi:hypothetical protein